MRVVAGAFGVLVIAVMMWDVFEALVLPRRVTRRLRPTRLFYRTTWRLWLLIGRRLSGDSRRETYLSFYGPLSLLLLLDAWAAILIAGFAPIYWAATPDLAFSTALYFSGTTFFTLGLGDIAPTGSLSRALAVVEAGTGFAFLAIVIGYLPVVYQAFSRREVNVSLLDARAGSPPSAAELLRRHAGNMDALERLLYDWERWSAELLESHLSYPVLSYYRSQHDNQSWLGALTTILDASALVMVGGEGSAARQAQLTFAMARHAVADLAQVLQTPPRRLDPDRLGPDALTQLRTQLASTRIVLDGSEMTVRRLTELRAMYEPYVNALAERLLMRLPTWTIRADGSDNWRRTAWEPAGSRGGAISSETDGHDHF
jgi:Ion channel